MQASDMSINFIATIESIQTFVEDISNRTEIPLIFVDLEGVNLSRHGTIAIMQVLAPPDPTIHLLDVHSLQNQAFEAKSSGGKTWRSILESESYAKVFFDVRNDSDALYSHFHIQLRGVIDLQLIEFATRPRQGRFLKGLAKCISEDCNLAWADYRAWEQIKENGNRAFAPEKGGSYDVFLQRPLSPAIQAYCAQDVSKLPTLLSVYALRLQHHLAEQVGAETLRRVTLSQSASFNGQGRHMAQGPSFSWYRNQGAPAPKFPMSLVCSPKLAIKCLMNEPRSRPESSTQARDLSSSAVETREQGNTINRVDSPAHRAGDPLVDIESALAAIGLEDEDATHVHTGYERTVLTSSRKSTSYSPDEGSVKDFAACSGDDCGWCGHCDY